MGQTQEISFISKQKLLLQLTKYPFYQGCQTQFPRGPHWKLRITSRARHVSFFHMLLFHRKSQPSFTGLLHVSYSLLTHSLIDIKPQKSNLAIKEKSDTNIGKKHARKGPKIVGKSWKNIGKSDKN